MFDITKVNGIWLSSEEKRLYHLQLKSKGNVGYSEGKLASAKTIHPSKRRKVQIDSPSTSTSATVSSCFYECSSRSSSSGTESDNSNYDEENETTSKTRKYSKSKVATNLVTSTGVSINKAAKICKQLSLDGVDVPSPSQAAIYKATFKEASKLKRTTERNIAIRKLVLTF